MQLGRVAAAAVLLVTGMAEPAMAAPPDSSAAAVSQALRDGTLGDNHTLDDPCGGVLQGHQVDLGCLARVVTQDRTSASPLTTPAPAGFSPPSWRSRSSCRTRPPARRGW